MNPWFKVIGPDGLAKFDSAFRQISETFAIQQQVDHGEGKFIPYLVVNEVNVVVSVITDDANGPKLHRLDGWNPPEPKPCVHEINHGVGISLDFNNGTPVLIFECQHCAKPGSLHLHHTAGPYWKE